LSPYIIDANCLDLFAGTGVLGFEALSRGAAKVTFIEKDFATLRQLKECAQMLKTNEAVFQSHDALKWLAQPATQLFNIVFLDPPFNKGLLAPILELLIKNNWLAPEAIIYIEMERDLDLILPENWQWIRQEKTRQIKYGLLEVE
jgi:16S rRNA (guanine966-N2)-methyltransferase